MDAEFKGIWIPKEIWLNKELKPTEKIMLAEIESFGLEGCDKPNKYFEDYLNFTSRRVAKIIKRFEERGYISRTNVYKPNSKQIDKRILKIIPKE